MSSLLGQDVERARAVSRDAIAEGPEKGRTVELEERLAADGVPVFWCQIDAVVALYALAERVVSSFFRSFETRKVDGIGDKFFIFRRFQKHG